MLRSWLTTLQAYGTVTTPMGSSVAIWAQWSYADLPHLRMQSVIFHRCIWPEWEVARWGKMKSNGDKVTTTSFACNEKSLSDFCRFFSSPFLFPPLFSDCHYFFLCLSFLIGYFAHSCLCGIDATFLWMFSLLMDLGHGCWSCPSGYSAPYSAERKPFLTALFLTYDDQPCGTITPKRSTFIQLKVGKFSSGPAK